MLTFVGGTKNLIDLTDSNLRSERLKPFKDMLFWFPTRFIHSLNTHPSVMLLMAHLHAIALFIDPVINGNSADFRSLNAAPIEEFYEEFCLRSEIEMKAGEKDGPFTAALTLMEFPIRAVTTFQCWLYNPNLGKDQNCDGNLNQIWVRSRRRRNMSMVEVLENFPVGLWYNSL